MFFISSPLKIFIFKVRVLFNSPIFLVPLKTIGDSTRMKTKDSIIHLVRWLCGKLCIEELLVALFIILDVIIGERDDIKVRNRFQDQHPQYRKFYVDPLSPLTEAPPLLKETPKKDYKVLLKEYRLKTGKDLKPVKRRRNSQLPPKGARCTNCNAPEHYLYVNDGRKRNQLRCKVCNTLFPSNRYRRESNAKYWCPYCDRALYLWKKNESRSLYKCGNKACSCYLKNLEKLNEREKKLQKTGMRSQFKLCYQYPEYHFNPAELKTAQPQESTRDLNRIHAPFNTVGLVLAYSVSFGLSTRMTKQMLRDIHNITISRQTVLNYQKDAAYLASKFINDNTGTMDDKQIAGDETYIKVVDKWNYTWFVIGAQSRAIRAFNLSNNRGALPAIATLNQLMKSVPEKLEYTIEFVADGNPSYDAAIHAINAIENQNPLKRRKVIGLSNTDDESEQFRPVKQIIERLNRTYKFHTRARCGFKNFNGAVTLTTLFVAYYNFLRPHGSLKYKPPIKLKCFDNILTIQGKWLQMLQLA